MSNLSQFFGGGGIKSIQTVSAQQTSYSAPSGYSGWRWEGSVTINPVDVNKTVLISDIGDAVLSTSEGGVPNSGQFAYSLAGHSAILSSSTSLTFVGPNADNSFNVSAIPAKIYVQVVEFN